MPTAQAECHEPGAKTQAGTHRHDRTTRQHKTGEEWERGVGKKKKKTLDKTPQRKSMTAATRPAPTRNVLTLAPRACNGRRHEEDRTEVVGFLRVRALLLLEGTGLLDDFPFLPPALAFEAARRALGFGLVTEPPAPLPREDSPEAVAAAAPACAACGKADVVAPPLFASRRPTLVAPVAKEDKDEEEEAAAEEDRAALPLPLLCTFVNRFKGRFLGLVEGRGMRDVEAAAVAVAATTPGRPGEGAWVADDARLPRDAGRGWRAPDGDGILDGILGGAVDVLCDRPRRDADVEVEVEVEVEVQAPEVLPRFVTDFGVAFLPPVACPIRVLLLLYLPGSQPRLSMHMVPHRWRGAQRHSTHTTLRYEP